MLSPRSHDPEHAGSSALGTLAAETELRHFLKLARPEWSKPRRRGRSDVVRVQEKLKAVGVTDIDTLIKMVDKNTINEELYNRGYVPLSREALDSIRKRKTFMQALEGVDVPNIRQVGFFDPVAQMLSRRQLQGQVGRRSTKKGEEGGRQSSRRPAIVQTESSMAEVPEEMTPPPWPRLRGAQGGPHGRVPRRPSAGLVLPSMSASGGVQRSQSETMPRLPSMGGASAATSMGRLERGDTSELHGDPFSRSTTKRGSAGLFGDGAPVTMRTMDSWLSPSMEEMLSLQRAGQRMLDTLEDSQSSAAKWSPKSRKTPLEQGEEMLMEQDALDERERLVRVVKSKSQPPDPFRSHIAFNIKQRLEDLANDDSKEGLAINQRCLNIRKQLAPGPRKRMSRGPVSSSPNPENPKVAH
ncbi:unnamed protein product [Durusdinium trenchii]|uniref:Uncharacterized protein n=1 Tax=Durusdinium trenchii TaxID=1381693 RepID=A0ABP0M2R3_9DINO